MAEVVDLFATLAGDATGGVDTCASLLGGGRRTREAFLFSILTLGKLADIAADWVVVAELIDGAFAGRTDTKAVLIVAVACAVLGSAIEIFAFILKVALQRDVEEGDLRTLENLRLNRRLAWPRFLCDDLPATIVGIYLISTSSLMAGGLADAAALVDGLDPSSILNHTECTTVSKIHTIHTTASAEPLMVVGNATATCTVVASGGIGSGRIAGEVWLIALSCGYSLLAMAYHLLKKPGKIADELKARSLSPHVEY